MPEHPGAEPELRAGHQPAEDREAVALGQFRVTLDRGERVADELRRLDALRHRERELVLHVLD